MPWRVDDVQDIVLNQRSEQCIRTVPVSKIPVRFVHPIGLPPILTWLIGVSQNPNWLTFPTTTEEAALYFAGFIPPSVISPSCLPSARRGIFNETMDFFKTPDLRRLSTRVSVCCLEIVYKFLKHEQTGELKKRNVSQIWRDPRVHRREHPPCNYLILVLHLLVNVLPSKFGTFKWSHPELEPFLMQIRHCNIIPDNSPRNFTSIIPNCPGFVQVFESRAAIRP